MKVGNLEVKIKIDVTELVQAVNLAIVIGKFGPESIKHGKALFLNFEKVTDYNGFVTAA